MIQPIRQPAAPRPNFWRRASSLLYKKPWLGVVLLLAPPLLWLVVFYLGSLLNLLFYSFYSIDEIGRAHV